MRKLMIIAVLGIAATWAAQRADLVPRAIQEGLDELKVRVGLESAAYFTFQQFATAIVRNDIDTIGRLAQQDGVREHARQIALNIRRSVRDVGTPSYRLDAVQNYPTGAVSVEVTQTMRPDLISPDASIGSPSVKDGIPQPWRDSPRGGG